MLVYLVPTHVLRVAPRAARGAVATLDVAETPLDLSGRVGLPVAAGRGHLLARQGLRDAVRTRAAVLGLVVPAAFPLPQLLEAGELGDLEAGFEHQGAADGPVAAELVARGGDVAGELRRAARTLVAVFLGRFFLGLLLGRLGVGLLLGDGLRL